MKLKNKAKQLKTDVPAVFLALKAKETPWYVKAVAAITVAYALSPVDLVPDFVPILGYLDDLIILPMLVAFTVKMIPKEIFEEYRTRSADMWANGKPKKWYYSLPVITIWILILWLIFKMIFLAKETTAL